MKRAANLLFALYALLACSTAFSQAYPAKPVRLIVPFPPGGPTDTHSRWAAQQLYTALGQPVIVENRAGAAGVIGTEAAAKATADGYTLLGGNPDPLTIAPAIRKQLGYDPIRDFAPITLIARSASCMCVHPTVPAGNLKAFIAVARANPGKINYATPGVGTVGHLAIENFSTLAGIKMTHVPYKSAVPVMTDLIAGEIHVFCPAVPMLPPYLKSGRIRALGVTYTEPTKLLSGVPPVSDTVAGFSLYGWYGVHVPRKTPPAIVRKINAELVKALKDPQLARIMLAAGAEAVGSTPEEYTAWLRKDTDHWTKLLQESGATLGKP